MKKSSMRDMTMGSPMKLILGFMLPFTLGLIFQQFYNMVDTVVVGQFLGVNALAGVGSTGSLNFLVLGFCTGICSGFAIPVAQKFGQKDYEGLRQYVANAKYLSIGFSLIIMAVTCVFCKPILTATNTDPEFFKEAHDYIFFIFLGIPAIMMYNMLSGIIRSLGDSRTPLYFLLLSSVLNIVLDLITVLWLHMGVEGPALATVISQAVAGIGCYIFMVKRFDILKTNAEERRPSLRHMLRLCGMGIPMGLQCSITAIGGIILQSVVNSFGTVYVAAVATGGKVFQLFSAPLDALGTTEATFAGQNVGAIRLDRVKSGVKDGMIIGTCYCAVAFLVIYFFGHHIAVMFLDPNDPASAGMVLTLAQKYQRVMAAAYIPLLIIYVYRFAIQGMGFSHYAMFAGVCEMIARCVVALVLAPQLGFDAVYWANPAAWVAADVFLIPCFYVCIRQLQKRFSAAI